MFHIFNWKIEFYSPEMVVGNGWCCLFGFLFEISFRCERELNAKPRVRTNPMAVLRLLGMVMALGRLLLQKGTTKVQSCQYCLKSKLFSKKQMMFQTLKKPCQKKSKEVAYSPFTLGKIPWKFKWYSQLISSLDRVKLKLF